MPPQNPSVIFGVVRQNGVVQAGIVVTFLNLSTSDSTTRITDTDGSFILDDLNSVEFPNGFSNGQSIQVSFLHSSVTITPIFEDATEQDLYGTALSESGTSIDTLAQQAIVSIADSGSGVESTSPSAILLVSESTTGADSILIVGFISSAISEAGLGADGVTVSVSISVSDSVSGSDATSEMASIGISDLNVSSFEALSLNQEDFVLLADDAVGSEYISIDTIITVPDSAIGFDIPDRPFVYTISETGAGIDIVVINNATGSSSPFYGLFTWSYGLVHVSVVPGYTMDDGTWVPEGLTESTIDGHISDVTQEDMQYIDPGLISAGVRKLGVERTVGLLVGDRVKITEISGEITEWFVHTKQSFSGLLAKHAGIRRETFLLRRKR